MSYYSAFKSLSVVEDHITDLLEDLGNNPKDYDIHAVARECFIMSGTRGYVYIGNDDDLFFDTVANYAY